jgi:hypothetical protein
MSLAQWIWHPADTSLVLTGSLGAGSLGVPSSKPRTDHPTVARCLDGPIAELTFRLCR